MRKEYDFSTAKRGAVTPPTRAEARGKTRITIRLDNATLDWFRAQVHADGGGSYQKLINEALGAFVESQTLETMMRRVVREELRRANPRTAKSPRKAA